MTDDDNQWKELIINNGRKKEQHLKRNNDTARPDEMAYSLYLKKKQQQQQQQQQQKLLHKEDKLQKLETVTTVPKLQQPFDKLSNLENAVILSEVSATANTAAMGTATTSVIIVPTSTIITTMVKTTATTSLSSSSLLHLSETALAKFNRIIDSTMSATNIYSSPRQTEDFATLRHMTAAKSTILEQCLTDFYTSNSNSSKMNNTNSNTGTSATSSFTGFMEPELDTDLDDRYAMKRNDVHYLLKQFNSFSDIEEIEIIGSKQQQQKQKEPQKQLIQKQEKEISNQEYNQPKQHQQQKHQQQYLDECLESKRCQTTKNEKIMNRKLEQEQEQKKILVEENKEEEMHSTDAMYISPTATSLVLYSPTSQSHKGIRRYASLHQSKEFSHYQENHHIHQHSSYQFHQNQYPPYYPNIPHEHSADACIGRMKVADPRALQQFLDDYIFESCHYLEAEHFTANYRTAMVESSSHEFRPSTTTTATQSIKDEHEDIIDNIESKSNGIDRKYGDIEDDNLSISSSARSFELHETEPPSVICKAPAPTQAPVSASTLASAPTRTGYQTMETRLCSSGVQTDLTASSLGGDYYIGGSMKISSSLSSSTPSSERRARRKPLFKCCYTPLDRWREKRSRGTKTHTNKSEMEKTIELTHSLEQPFNTKTTTILAAGSSGSGSCSGTRTMLTESCGTFYGSHAV